MNDSIIDKAQQTVFNPLYVYFLTVPTNWSNTAFWSPNLPLLSYLDIQVSNWQKLYRASRVLGHCKRFIPLNPGGKLRAHWRLSQGIRPQGLRKQDVMEGFREAAGHHQTLLQFPRDWSELASDGTVRGKAIYR